jgi:hypothetical protein
MENDARRKDVNTHDSGDPLWYFRIYGTADPARTWHRA